MIYEALQIIGEQLNNYLSAAGLNNLVTLDNVAMLETSAENTDRLGNKVILTLINLEEEPSLKNLQHYKVIDKLTTEYRNPPVNVNVYFMVSGNCTAYTDSLRAISKTIEFFQGKNIFTSENTVYEVKEDFDVLEAFRLIIQQYSASFEQLNHIWGTLGGRQLPSVIYKIQLIKIDQKLLQGTEKVILEVTDTLKFK
jgi:hypothetical protein